MLSRIGGEGFGEAQIMENLFLYGVKMENFFHFLSAVLRGFAQN